MNDMDRTRDYGRDGYRSEDPDLEAYEYEEEDSGVRMPLFVILALVVIACIVGVWFVAYNYGLQKGRAENARFIAGNTAVERVRPENPGGMAAPGQRDVFNRMNGTGPGQSETVVSREEPIVELPRPAQTNPAQPAPTRQQPAATQPSLRNPTPTQTASVPAPTRTQPTVIPQPVETTRTDSQDGRVLVPPPSSALRQPGATVSVPAPSSAGPIGPQLPRPSASANGGFVVQLASLPSQAAADQTWSRVAARYSDLMGGFSKDVQPVDLGARGTFYRLRIGYFNSRNAAGSFCQTLKARGQDCLVASR